MNAGAADRLPLLLLYRPTELNISPQEYSVALSLALASALILTRLVGAHALRIGLVDPIDDRKTHTGSVPRLGGVAIVGALVVVLILVVILRAQQWLAAPRSLVVLLAGGSAIFALGLYDDLKPIRARYKLAGEVLIACFVAGFGFRFTDLAVPFADTTLHIPALAAFALLVAWLVGVTNAFNLIDGVDGLAGGVALIALSSMFGVSLLLGNPGVALVAVALIGALVGFLCFNFYPATIFLGDSGSLFLGFMLAGLGLLSAQKSPTAVEVIIPIIVLALPILDTGLTILRRFLRLQPIFAPDRGHIHHRLLARGYSPRSVALLLYVAAGIFGAAGFFLAYSTDSVLPLIVFVSVLFFIGVITLIHHLGFIEFEELGRFVGRAWRPRETISRNVRFREAGRRLATLANVEEIFRSLGAAFDDERIPRAELRLQPWFLKRGPSVVVPEVRETDEVIVWHWQKGLECEPTCWEVLLPLLSTDDRRIGSLVIWEKSESVTSLSHLHVINRSLRLELEHKLQSLGWDPGYITEPDLHRRHLPDHRSERSEPPHLPKPEPANYPLSERIAASRQQEL